MYFTKIELYNYGIYKGRHCVELENQNEGRNITLIGGMNGRGKTTILDAIFLCLYGRKAVEYITGKKETYSSMLDDHINKSAEDQEAFVRLEIETDEGVSNLLSIKRTWKRNGKRIDTTLEVTQNGAIDEYLSQNWEYYVEELVPFGIAKFFFFDNEKISQIADDDAFDKVKDSIKSVMGVTTIESLSAHMTKIAKIKSDALKAFQDSEAKAELDSLDKQLQKVEQEIRTLKDRRAGLSLNFERILATLETTEEKFWKRGGNLGLNRAEIEAQKERLKEIEKENKLRAIDLASSPMTPLCLCKNLVVEAYNTAKRDDANRAKQYSEPIVLALYNGLIARCQKKFGKTQFYDILKDVIDAQFDEYRPDPLEATPTELTPMSKALIEKMINEEYVKAVNLVKYLKAQNEINENALLQLDVHLNSNADEAGAVELLTEIRDLEAQKGRYEAEMVRCDEGLNNLEHQQAAFESDRTRALMKIAVQADENDDNARILKYATMTIDVMQEFTIRLQAQKVHQLEANITQCFRYLAQKQAMITSISIDPATLDITLRDYNGGVLRKNQLSAGEKQMFAISILWGLALTSGYKLPVVIDTPMARLDSAHRSNFISRYLPKASSQVIVLSTDEEIYGQYLESIRPYINTCYTLIYDDIDKCSSIKPGYFGGEVL